MSTASRPRPRPKPRPRQPSVTPSSPGPASSFKCPAPHGSTAAVIVIDDDDEEDAMFIRQPALDWSRKSKEKGKRKASKALDSGSSDSEPRDSPPSRTQAKKRNAGKKDVLPDWTKSSHVMVDFDDDIDDILEQRLADTTPSAKRVRRETEKRSSKKRLRSRSRSLTPPPELPQHLIQSAMDKIRDMIPVAPRIPSPTLVLDESTDSFELDPELALIDNDIKAGKHAHTPGGSRGNTPAFEGGPEIVTLRVKWKPHPLNDAARPQQWDFKMKRHDPFKGLFEETADEAAIVLDNLIVTHHGTRVFPSASPHGIGIWAETELEACDKITYEYLRAQQRRSPSLAPDRATTSSLTFAGSLPTTQEESEEESELESVNEDKGDKFKIILRSKAGKDISLTVRPTTKCGAIVKAFLKSAGLTDKYPGAGEVAGQSVPKKGRKKTGAPVLGGPWLVVDGDKMANHVEIGDADLEDGDMIEITGL